MTIQPPDRLSDYHKKLEARREAATKNCNHPTFNIENRYKNGKTTEVKICHMCDKEFEKRAL